MTASEAIEKMRSELADRLEMMIRLSNADDTTFLREMADLLMRVACIDGYTAGYAACLARV